MNKTFETIERLAHAAIDAAGKVAVTIAKAIATLICLGASVSYSTGQKLGKHFYKNSHNISRPDTSNDAENDTTIKLEVKKVKPSVAKAKQVKSNLNDDTLSDSINVVDEIVDIYHDINIVTPVTKVNPIHRFINNRLRNTLETNLLEATSYTLPRNKRVKSKTHIRHDDIGVLKEYYPVLVATGTLR